jgi:hypothetical protein
VAHAIQLAKANMTKGAATLVGIFDAPSTVKWHFGVNVYKQSGDGNESVGYGTGLLLLEDVGPTIRS